MNTDDTTNRYTNNKNLARCKHGWVKGSGCEACNSTTPLTFPRPPALIAEYWKVVAHERQKMFRAWSTWLDQRPNPDHVEHEIEATASAMRQMVRLRDKTPSAEDGWVTCRDEQCRSAGRCIYRAAPEK